MIVNIYFCRSLNRPNLKFDKVSKFTLTDTHVFIHTFYGSVIPIEKRLIRYVNVKCDDGFSYKIQF